MGVKKKRERPCSVQRGLSDVLIPPHKYVAMDKDHNTTIPSRLMANEFANTQKPPPSNIHPVFKILLGVLVMIVVLALLKRARA